MPKYCKDEEDTGDYMWVCYDIPIARGYEFIDQSYLDYVSSL